MNYPHQLKAIAAAKRKAAGQDSPDTVCRIRGSVDPELPTLLSLRFVLTFSWSQLQELLRRIVSPSTSSVAVAHPRQLPRIALSQ